MRDLNNMTRLEKYCLAWNYYLDSCKVVGEEVKITMNHYINTVPMSQVEEMIVMYDL
jgi:phage terminase small subunit